MKIEQVGVQLYTLRDYLKTPEDFQETLQKVADIGYKSVEIANRPMSEDELASLCAEKGLVVCASHESTNDILNDPATVIEHLEEFGCRYAVYPYPGELDLQSREVVVNLIRGLDNSGRALNEAGKLLAYHNHDMELKLLDGKPVLERLFAETGPNHLHAELDTYWLHVAGASPEAWCAYMRGRLPLLHIKDCLPGEDGKPQFAEIGSGVLDFKRIIAIAEVSGCEWFIVEQDVCPGDPFESLEKSFRYIHDNLVG